MVAESEASLARDGGVRGDPPPAFASAIAVGAVCGLAWASGFRAYMMLIAGPASRFDWVGTFVAILLPGVVVGALLGLAEAIRRRGGRRHWRWLGLAPLAFAVVPLALPGALVDFLTQGLGGGAVGVAVAAIAGGFALSGRGAVWARIVGALVALVIAAGVALTVPMIGGRALALSEPRGLWAAILAGSFVIVLCLASSIPFRTAWTRVGAGRPGAREHEESS
ncbi:hypothetical protein ET445_04195 [Agromyces protaetiae]|uniref:Uncharacterized protein n=1 Tax=Agromyces protaetiae TaxID=2509455 RepID=A0A4P6FAI3_9MICO|nr:hypothetical protein [Agromyces protaetiae]QAY72665.1 hypothetical protein ET445_04195 [Agromyces protaetiae]